jgi:RimJ/RimL family protein N-acetyltransferase
LTEIRTSVLAAAEAESLRESLGSLLYGPLRAWPGEMPADRRADYWLDEIRSVLSSPGSAAFVARVDGRTAGLAVVADQVWETRALGRQMAGIRYLAAAGDSFERAAILERLLDEAVRHAKERGAECLVHRTFADDAPAIHALERRGFLLVDTLLDCVYDYPRDGAPPHSSLPPDVLVRPVASEDLDGLLEVSRRAFAVHSGRFHSDERIPHDRAVGIYEEWIRSCVEGWADWVLAAECRGVIVGYSAWKKPSETERRHEIALGHYSIGAVVPEHSARGLFRALTLEGIRLLAGHAQRVEGPTHVTNVPVQRAYAALGWRVAGARHGFHRWSKP